ncbi:MAG TPA: hypothetical protein VL977_04355 [Solirubrobacteraceae bacterium]|nr:hypothetical protein [Solirubrobacteraceae bacterium]
MSSRAKRYDTIAVVLYVLALAAAVVELFYKPFGFGPLGALLVMAGLITSTKHRRLGALAVTAVGVCWVIGAAVAVWYSNPLY